MRCKIYYFILLFATFFISGFSQVKNDSIKSRSSLELNSSPLSSSTNNGTVEWACVNKAFTSKCLQYHNDQWFSFFVNRPGNYFINISAQECRDNQGIQFLLIEGNPCKTAAFKVLSCLPRIKILDVFIEMDSLKTETQYLVNIDGFLGDFCDFKIQLSTEPRGLKHSSPNMDVLQVEARAMGNVNHLSWTVPRGVSDSLKAFQIYRYTKASKRAEHIATIASATNARGQVETAYGLQDTVIDRSVYTYEILGRFNTSRLILLSTRTVGPDARAKNDQNLTVELDFENNTEVQLLLLDGHSGQILQQASFPFNKTLDFRQNINVSRFTAIEISNFIVRAVNLKTRSKKDFYFHVTANGEVIAR